MFLDDFLADHLDERAYHQPNFYFWVRTVCEAMSFVGPETDADLEGMIRQLENHHAGHGVAADVVDKMRDQVVRLRGARFCADTTSLGLKYRCFNAIADSREQNLADLDNWQYGVRIAWQTINFYDDKDQELIQFIRHRAKEQKIELYEKNDEEVPSDRSAH